MILDNGPEDVDYLETRKGLISVPKSTPRMETNCRNECVNEGRDGKPSGCTDITCPCRSKAPESVEEMKSRGRAEQHMADAGLEWEALEKDIQRQALHDLTQMGEIEKAPTDEGWKGEIISLVGEALMCWNPTPTGVFDSEEAITIAFKICKIVEELLQKARHNLAQINFENGYKEGKALIEKEREKYLTDEKRTFDFARNLGVIDGKSEAFSLVRKTVEGMSELRSFERDLVIDKLDELSTLEGGKGEKCCTKCYEYAGNENRESCGDFRCSCHNKKEECGAFIAPMQPRCMNLKPCPYHSDDFNRETPKECLCRSTGQYSPTFTTHTPEKCYWDSTDKPKVEIRELELDFYNLTWNNLMHVKEKLNEVIKALNERI